MSRKFGRVVRRQNFKHLSNFSPLSWLKYVLCLILFFALTIANIATWASSDTDIGCELFQAPCTLLFGSDNQAFTSLSNMSIPECFESCHPEIQNSLFPQISAVTQESAPITCKCTKSSGGDSSTYRHRLRLNKPLRHLVCTTLPLPFQNTCLETATLCKLTKYPMPPDHLKSLSTIVIIV